MKILYTGGIKSGKSRAAEAKALELSPHAKPYYLATSEALDDEMRERIARHKEDRSDRFITVEEPLKLYDAVSTVDGAVIIECLSLWINNMLYYGKDESEILEQISKMMKLDKNIVLVINEVGFGIIPDSPLARKFADISGRVGQAVAAACDEVYLCAVGLNVRMK